jgi:hypothetical protein
MSLRETGKEMTPGYLWRELREGANALTHHDNGDSLLRTGRRLGHLLGTIGFTPEYLLTHARITRDLWRGEAGTFIESVPEETVFIAHFLESSRFNHRSIYKAAIEQLPYGRTIWEPGLHLTPMKRPIIRAYVGKVVCGLELLEAGASQSDIADALDYPLQEAA